MLINQTGAYRGLITDLGAGQTTNGIPQAVAQLVAGEYYDEAQGEWISWEGNENNEIKGYFPLFQRIDKKQPIADDNLKEGLNAKQIKLVTGWTGASFEELNHLCPEDGISCLFRVEEHTYNENITMQVAWIDQYDANPVRGVNKLDDSAAKDLTSKYAGILNASKAKSKAVSAKSNPTAPATGAAPAAAAPASRPAAPRTPSVKKVTGRPTTVPPASGAAPAAAPATAPVAKPKAPATPKGPPVGTCTQQEAWDAICALKSDKVSEDTVVEAWQVVVQQIAPGLDADKITGAQWYRIKEGVTAKVSSL